MSSGLAIATTDLSADVCGSEIAAGADGSFIGSAGLAADGCRVSTAGEGAAAVVGEAVVDPNFGSANTPPAAPDRRRTMAVEARSRSIRTPSIAVSPLEAAKRSQALTRIGDKWFPTSSILRRQSLIGTYIREPALFVAARGGNSGPIHAIFRGCRSVATAPEPGSALPSSRPKASNFR